MLGDSSTLPPCSVAYFTNLLDGTGVINSCEAPEEDAEGSKKGNTPEGEAWLFEETRRWSMPAIFKKVYLALELHAHNQFGTPCH